MIDPTQLRTSEAATPETAMRGVPCLQGATGILLLALLLATVWLPWGCAYPGHSRDTSWRERPIAHPPPEESRQGEKEDAEARSERSRETRIPRESVKRTFPNEPGHAFFGKATHPQDFSEELLETCRDRLAELLYAVAGLAIQRIREQNDEHRDWSWTERLGIVVRSLAREAPRVWSYRSGRNSTIVVEVRYHTVLEALLDEFALEPDRLDEVLRHEHEQLGERPFAMRTVQWRRDANGESAASQEPSAEAWETEDAPPFSHVHLIAIGVTQARDESFPRWPTARADAHALAEAFARQELVFAGNGQERHDWGLDARRPVQTTVLMDEQATRKAIYEAAAGAVTRNQHVLLLYAGHTLEYDGETWLVPVDGSREEITQTCISLDELTALALAHRNELEKPADDVPIGAWISEGRVEALETSPWKNDEDAPGADGRELWVRAHATHPKGQAVSDELRGHGLFTYFLVRALRIAPDADAEHEETDEQAGPQWLTTTQLLQQTRNRVEPVARSLGARQQPTGPNTAATLAFLQSNE